MLENELSPLNNEQTIYLKDYQPPHYRILTVSLEFELFEEFALVKSTLNCRRQVSYDCPLKLDGEKMELISVIINGESIDVTKLEVTENSLTIEQLPNEFELQITTKTYPHLNTELSGLYQSSGNFCTQCEAEGFRRITYFQDRPDVLSIYDVKITANEEKYPILLSNGNLSDSGKNNDGTHWTKWTDPHPKPSYLFALVAGGFESIQDEFITQSGNKIELNIFTQAHNIDKCDHAMKSLIESMKWDEKVYGREYDLELYNIVAVDDFNMGAMENKGLNIFNSKYVLANQQTATDTDYEGIESVIGHEYFHNWSGNRVTCRDWFQLSLKEGFTVFRDQEFSADMGSRSVKRIRDVQVLRTHQFKEDAGPMAHPIRPDSYQEINNFYTVTIYEKGAEVIRMLYHITGCEGFRKGTDLYFDEFDGQAVTTEDFVVCMEQANGICLKQFRNWYTQSGTPQVEVIEKYDSENRNFSLTFTQSCPETPNQKLKQPFVIPISLALLDKNGIESNEQTFLLQEESQVLKFKDIESKPIVSLLRDFSSPVKVNYDQSNEELAHLIEYDNNGFTCWEAMQRLSLNLILPGIEGNEVDEKVYQGLLSALKKLIDSEPKDKAILSEMLRLPSSSYVAEQCNLIDPIKIQNVRQLIIEKLAVDLATRFEHLYNANNTETKFSLDPESIAMRSIKNCALGYLVELKQDKYYQMALIQYNNANNMTDRLAAYNALTHSDYSESQDLIDDFYNQWSKDTLVMDKWFSLQALDPKSNVLDRVKLLLDNDMFSINNPNKVRSLIGSFTANLSGFHRIDGEGYKFLTNKIIELNTINPQIAARLSGTFNNWKRYEQPYSNLMHAQLLELNNHPHLVKDIKEIVSKALKSEE